MQSEGIASTELITTAPAPFAFSVEARQAIDALTQTADLWSAQSAIAEYMTLKSANTRKARRSDVDTFVAFLADFHVDSTGCNYHENIDCWSWLTAQTVELFRAWMQRQGFTTSSINRKVGTIKIYARLAMKAGKLPPNEYVMIKCIESRSKLEGQRIDEERAAVGLPTRIGHKKADPILLTAEQVERILFLPKNPQGARDRLMLTILLEHGLRVSELALLAVGDMQHADDKGRAAMRFYRPKVDNHGQHTITQKTLDALAQYDILAEPDAPLLRRSEQGGALLETGLSERGIHDRVKWLGRRIGIGALGVHDFRHTCATDMSRRRYGIPELMNWFGWANPQTAMRYVQMAEFEERDRG